MHRMYALLGVAILAVATSVANAEVLELSQDTFDSLAFTKEFALIEFYAPWCGHCKALEPEYTRLGDTIVSDFGVDNVVIAKIDATAAEALAEQYGIQGFPTIKFFRSSDRKSIDYMNEPSYDGLVEFIQDNILPPAIEVEVWQDVEEARKSDSLFILGYFPGDAAGAQRFKDVAFGSSMTHLLAEKRFPEIEEVYDVTGSAVVVVPAKGGDIVKLADTDIAETGAMTAAIRRTLISQFSQWDEDNLDIALESGIEYFGLLFREPSDADILSLFSKMAPKMPSNFVAMYAGDADDHLVEFFEIDPSSLPQFRILYLKNEQEEPVVYSYDQANLTEVGVLDFIARTFDGTVEPTALLTDPYAETPDGYEDEDLASPMEDQYGDVHEEL